MKIQIHKNIFGFSNFLICVTNKEVFMNGYFENIPTALIAMEKNSIDREEILLSQIKQNLQYECDLTEYIQKNQEHLNEIQLKLQEKNLNYSWLQMLQLHMLENNNNDLENNIVLLNKFYKKYLIKEISI